MPTASKATLWKQCLRYECALTEIIKGQRLCTLHNVGALTGNCGVKAVSKKPNRREVHYRIPKASCYNCKHSRLSELYGDLLCGKVAEADSAVDVGAICDLWEKKDEQHVDA